MPLHRDLEKMVTGDPENPRVQLAVGYTLETEILPYEELLSRSGTAMNRAENGQGYSYQTLDQESGGSYGRENLTAMIYSADFSGDMINYAFHLFENSNYIKSTVPLLIRRIGRKFGIDRILVFSVDPDFCTVRCEYQWQRGRTKSFRNGHKAFYPGADARDRKLWRTGSYLLETGRGFR